MTITLDDLFPNASTGLSQIGFLFGAGTSYAAGYPLTRQLTMSVLKKLSVPEIALVEKILFAESITLEVDSGSPDIEILSDILNKAKASGGYIGIETLIDSIRKHIVDVINEVASPNLEYHVYFLKGLKNRMLHRSESIWIFTTNYDIVFELAAAIAKIPIYNGFEGIADRFFDIDRFDVAYGRINGSRTFEPIKEPCIKFVKLHGSISWFQNDDDIIESFSKDRVDKRCMILPRRTKIIETLEAPYDKLFRYASSIIGNQCKYIVTCGYSFRDEHINDILFASKLRSKTLRLFALSKEETTEMLKFKAHPSFHYMVENKLYYKGETVDGDFQLWDFKKFVELFN